MSTSLIPTIEELEAETEGLNTHQLHQYSLKTRAELALARARVAESRSKHALGIHIPRAEIEKMNREKEIITAKSCHLDLIYARRQEARSLTENGRLQKQNDDLRAEVTDAKEAISMTWHCLACVDIPDAIDTLERYAKKVSMKLPKPAP